MWKCLKAAAAAAILGSASLPTSAAIFVFSNEFSGAQNCANVVTVSGCATLEVTASTGGVDFLLTGNLATGEHIKELSGNEFPFSLLITDFSAFSGTGASAVEKVLIKENGLKADGDGYFDWTIVFKKSDSGPRFDGTDTLLWTIANTTIDAIIGIDAISVNGPAGKNGFVFAIHAGGFANDGSGWFNGVPGNGGGGQELSEPGMLSLLGLGLLMAGFVRRRRSMA